MPATPEQIQEILQLRERNVAPKQIARKLKLRPAEVSAIIRANAKAHPETHQRELPALKECLINAHAADYFFPQQKRGSWLQRSDKKTLEQDGVGGLAQVIVTRNEGSRYAVASYLVDFWCLGVKDAMSPRRMKPEAYTMFLQSTYDLTFGQDYRNITLEQAQAIVYGALDYASRLGLQPHKDFERAKSWLGPRLNNLPELEFGKDGQPFYINGPYDNPDKIVATLTKHVGQDNFRYVIQSGDLLDDLPPLLGEG
jgi:hypothetical protein